MATEVLVLFSTPMNKEKGIERRFLPLFYSCSIEATRAEDVVGRNAEIAAVDYNVPVVVLQKIRNILLTFSILSLQLTNY